MENKKQRKSIKKQGFSSLIIKFLGSKTFFWLVLILFVFQALWLALTFRYPMLYDESYHFGVTQFFSNGISPIIEDQSKEYDKYRDISREGSYLYHYLMSYPYRLIELITDRLAVQVISLRIINIALFATGLWIFAKMFRAMKVKPILTNVALLFFVLLPITPFVAATINYDNLLFPLTALFLYLCVNLIVKKKSPTINDYLVLVLLGFVACLVKFVFMPIFAASLIFLLIKFWSDNKSSLTAAKKLISTSNKKILLILSVLILIFALWFSHIHIKNIINYGSLIPRCRDTMAVERCQASGLVRRNIILEESTDLRERVMFPGFIFLWADQILNYVSWSGVEHSVNGKLTVNEKPLPVFHMTMFTLVVAGGFAALLSWRMFAKNIAYRFTAVVFFVYTAAVIYSNFASYNKYHQLIATQPRYFIVLLPLLMIFMVLGLDTIMRKIQRPAKIILFATTLFFIMNGAGLITHLMVSDDNWYWQNKKVIRINNAVKNKLTPIVTVNDDKL